jgi:hypothetical protein
MIPSFVALFFKSYHIYGIRAIIYMYELLDT